MSDYICPAEIDALFDDDATRPLGRQKAVEWVEGLNMRIGDRALLPEIGWYERTGPREDN